MPIEASRKEEDMADEEIRMADEEIRTDEEAEVEGHKHKPYTLDVETTVDDDDDSDDVEAHRHKPDLAEKHKP